MAQDLTTQIKIAEWRQKALEGTLTQEDAKEAIALLRAGRVGASYSADAAKRSKAKATIVHADSLLDELDGI